MLKACRLASIVMAVTALVWHDSCHNSCYSAGQAPEGGQTPATEPTSAPATPAAPATSAPLNPAGTPATDTARGSYGSSYDGYAQYSNWDQYRVAACSDPGYGQSEGQGYGQGAAGKFNPQAAIGMDTWYYWTGGNQFFFRGMTRRTKGNVDFVRLLAQTPRTERFQKLGMVNDPSCEPSTTPDEFGLTVLDKWKDEERESWEAALTRTYPDIEERLVVKAMLGEPTGVIGLRKFPNPLFPESDRETWKSGAGLKQYLLEPAKYEPPYLIGMSCALCHVAFEPTRPPKSIVNPQWHELSAVIGNQFIDEGQMFTQKITPDNFFWQIAHAQQAGTSDTSRISNDMFNNPNAINAIYQFQARTDIRSYERISDAQAVIIKESMPTAEAQGELIKEADGYKLKTILGLKDGSGTMGMVIESMRVYVNIGLFTIDDANLAIIDAGQQAYIKAISDGQYTDAERTQVAKLLSAAQNMFIHAIEHRRPFDIQAARKSQPIRLDPRTQAAFASLNPEVVAKYRKNFWMLTEERMGPMEAFLELASRRVPHLDDDRLRNVPLAVHDPAVKTVADYLSDRHLVPRGLAIYGQQCASCHSSRPLAKKETYTYEDFQEFRKNNFLSNDKRYPVSMLQTNAGRSMGTNPTRGKLWDQFSSETYKTLPSAGGLVNLFNPLTLQSNFSMPLPSDGRGYYRTPTLCAMWTTAPYFNNNSLGDYPRKDPSVAARVAAFETGVERLLWPEKRLGPRGMKMTTRPAFVPDVARDFTLETPLEIRPGKAIFIPQGTPVNLLANLDVEALQKALAAGGGDLTQLTPVELMQRFNRCPDFVEDKGHYFGSGLSDEDKQALISVLKRF
ncbi:MAG: hypothetical protein IT423_17585 [Pirellulaceae bacterium]|nr:hypothetical protein [Pirellulaceae bacterium]